MSSIGRESHSEMVSRSASRHTTYDQELNQRKSSISFMCIKCSGRPRVVTALYPSSPSEELLDLNKKSEDDFISKYPQTKFRHSNLCMHPDCLVHNGRTCVKFRKALIDMYDMTNNGCYRCGHNNFQFFSHQHAEDPIVIESVPYETYTMIFYYRCSSCSYPETSGPITTEDVNGVKRMSLSSDLHPFNDSFLRLVMSLGHEGPLALNMSNKICRFEAPDIDPLTGDKSNGAWTCSCSFDKEAIVVSHLGKTLAQQKNGRYASSVRPDGDRYDETP